MTFEKTERRQIQFSLAVGILIALLLAGIGYVMFRTINSAQQDEAKEYIGEVTEQYKSTIVKQIEGDLQTLKALSTFISEDAKFDLEKVLYNLKVENSKNDFIRMGFVDSSGEGYFMDISGKEYLGVDVGDEPFIQKALAGTPSVSEMMKDRFGDMYVNCYAVPLYHGSEIIGALTATNKADTFGEIIDGKIMNGEGYLHIIQKDGRYVARSEHYLVKKDIMNVFEPGVLSETEQKAAVGAMEKGQDYFTEAQYEGKGYWVNFKAIGINEWYIFCVVPKSSLNGNFEKLLQMFAVIMLLLVLIFLGLFYLIDRIIKHGRKSILQLAYFDHVTGIYNRNKFWNEALARLKTQKNYALVIMDIKNFKFVNELFGYGKGDLLLKHVASVCRDSVAEGELYYRENADRFGMLLLYQSEAELTKRVSGILKRISECPLSESQDYRIVCNCGIKMIDQYSQNIELEVCYDQANMALKKAKRQNETPIAYYDDQLHETAVKRNIIENSMEQALENGEFQMYLQPKVDLSTDEIKGAEALVRWIKKDGSCVFPDDFIPVLEKNGFITELDMYMLEQACKVLKEWKIKGYPQIRIAVNQSRIVFYKQGYLSQLREITQKYGVDPSKIVLEVTEGISIENIDEMADVIRELHNMGFTVSMDDFGSGYSSLNILKDLAIDELKLDKVFLSETREEEKGAVIMKNIISLAKELHITTVAEGIETKDQEEFLKGIHCDIGQGYYYSRPIPVEKFVDMAF